MGSKDTNPIDFDKIQKVLESQFDGNEESALETPDETSDETPDEVPEETPDDETDEITDDFTETDASDASSDDMTEIIMDEEELEADLAEEEDESLEADEAAESEEATEWSDEPSRTEETDELDEPSEAEETAEVIETEGSEVSSEAEDALADSDDSRGKIHISDIPASAIRRRRLRKKVRSESAYAGYDGDNEDIEPDETEADTEYGIEDDIEDDAGEKAEGGREWLSDGASLLSVIGSKIASFFRVLWASRKYRAVKIGAIVLVVAAAAFFIRYTVINHTYDHYAEDTDLVKEDTKSATYAGIGSNVLKFNLSEAELTTQSGKTVWKDSFTMTSPEYASSGDTFVIYDALGTKMRVYNEDGNMGSFETEMPIVKANISSNGDVAAVLESDNNTWIHYYKKNGDKIATLKTSIDNPGYPMDLTVSDDGSLLGVAFLNLHSGSLDTILNFYNFGTVGQNQIDNLVATEKQSDLVVPQIEFISDDTCIVFSDRGAVIYKGSQIPKKSEEIKLGSEILSVAHTKNNIAFIVENPDSKSPYTLLMYDMLGKKVFEKDVDFAYQKMKMTDEQILLYNASSICTYSTEGVKKFEDVIKETSISDVIPFGINYFMIVSDQGTFNIRLK